MTRGARTAVGPLVAVTFVVGAITVGLFRGQLAPAPSGGEPPSSSAEPAPRAEQASALPAIGGELSSRNAAGRTGWFFVPERAPGAALPILVGLHGQGGAGSDMVAAFRALATQRGFAIVAPSSGHVAEMSSFTWRVGDRPGDFPEDYHHVRACLEELLARADVAFDRERVLAVGFSGGASSAPFLATNTPPYTAFAVLHGGVFPGGLGARRVRGWFSTGAEDAARTPAHVRGHLQALQRAGFDVVYREFAGGHLLSLVEATAVVDWWLGVDARGGN